MHSGSPRVTQFLSGVIFDLKKSFESKFLFFFFYNLEGYERLLI